MGATQTTGEDFHGSDNVFADLGRPDPEEHLLKAKLVSRIQRLLDERGMTDAQAAESFDMTPANVDRMLRGGFRGIPIDQLIHYLRCLGYDVELSATVRERAPEAKKREQKEERKAVAT